MRIFYAKLLLTIASFCRFLSVIVLDRKPIFIVDALSLPGVFIINGVLYIITQPEWGSFWREIEMCEEWQLYIESLSNKSK